MILVFCNFKTNLVVTQFLKLFEKVTYNYLQYCAKVMQTIIDEYHALFLRFIADISAKHHMDCRTVKQ